MKETATLGNVRFRFDSVIPIYWHDKDLLFRKVQRPVNLSVSVSITTTETFSPLSGKNILTTGSTEFWIDSFGQEVRDYHASYLPTKPHYARSIWDGKTLKVLYRPSSGIWENPNFRIWNVLHTENHLLDADGLVLHCCWVEHNGEAILLTAPSGTGKTTHGKLWCECFGSSIANGDKALLQRTDGKWEVCGYPFHGSAPECENKTMPLKAIIILRQGKEDCIQELSPMNKVKLLLSEITVNFFNPDRVNKACDLLTDLVGQTKVAMLHCTMEDHAAHTLHNYIYTEE